ncbi:MAG: hypothetical protein NZV14_12145 [Bryobacteraceae bacterium]|nr:hypothetical protein [Bryobacteraceae bacterium]MDW8378904.1 hypothetical protein [Bryobacterales bacterium]
MRKKLWFLNLLLISGLALIARELHVSWKAAREREKKLAAKPAPKPETAIPATALPVAPPPAPVQAASYADVAQQMLFSKDRNPVVVIEAPPPKPQPPFPRFYGAMNLGDGMMAILSDGPSQQKPFRPGEKVGDYKLVEIAEDTLVFEWDGKRFPKKFDDLADRSEVSSDSTPQIAAAPAAPPPPPKPAAPGPGADIGGGFAACNPGDSSPPGTVINNMRKVVTETPFSKVCRWEPVK